MLIYNYNNTDQQHLIIGPCPIAMLVYWSILGPFRLRVQELHSLMDPRLIKEHRATMEVRWVFGTGSTRGSFEKATWGIPLTLQCALTVRPWQTGLKD